MAVYNVSYDLNAPGKNYDDLIAEIKESAEWIHLLKSTWLVSTSETAEQLFDRLKSHLDTSDRMLVAAICKNYQGWLTEAQWKWINDRVKQRCVD